MLHLLLLLVVLPLGTLHFLPTIIAALRDTRHVLGIFLLNLLTGWTVIGWVVALIWAITGERRWRPVMQAGTWPAWTGYRRF